MLTVEEQEKAKGSARDKGKENNFSKEYALPEKSSKLNYCENYNLTL
jgi:hypothetical protein